MLPGKVPAEILQSIVFSHLGKSDPSVILGPGLGEDASLIQVGDQIIVAATDPITGSVEDLGWLAVHVNANDIATFGVKPRWFLATIMLPKGFKTSELQKIMLQIDSAAKALDIAVVGGHSEITEKLEQPIIVGFMMGLTKEGQYVTSSSAQLSDAIILTKTIGIEGTAILAAEGKKYLSKHLSKETIQAARDLREQISVVKDGVVAFETGYVHAMHDPTEGGLSGAIHEMCDASGLGFEINFEKIPISEPTREICELLEVNPLELISSGSMIISCDLENTNSVIQSLESNGIQATMIGTLIEDPHHRKILKAGQVSDLAKPDSDALWEAIKKINPP
ncbi:MAG: AIR synthase family protein [Candidatus Thorarchaeota archaeon]|nr:AIR synthase family protein [Candidatus Thorarchaeota archaeon]